MNTQDGNIINGNCWVACFDIIGFKNLLKDSLAQCRTIEKAAIAMKIFVETDYYDILKEAKLGIEQHKELLDKIGHAWFSDTFLFYIPIDENGHAATVIESLATGFFCGCIWKRFALRGALSAGGFYSEPEYNIYVGPALIDAYEYTEKQHWIGFVISPSARSELQKINLCPPDRGKYAEYDVPIKTKEKNVKSEVVLKIETEKLFSFKMQKYMQVKDSVREMQREAEAKLCKREYDTVKAIYENTLKFIKDTKC